MKFLLHSKHNADTFIYNYIIKFTGIRKYVVESYNASFHGNNKSCLLTMVFSIMNLFGTSKANQEWSQTVNFAHYLKANEEDKNHLQDAKTSRFGKYSEFMVLISYHYE